jgi:hypothetical protein
MRFSSRGGGDSETYAGEKGLPKTNLKMLRHLPVSFSHPSVFQNHHWICDPHVSHHMEITDPMMILNDSHEDHRFNNDFEKQKNNRRTRE